MHHSDICAPDGWLDVLTETFEQERADMVSAVVPIKTMHGLASTGVVDRDESRRRRLLDVVDGLRVAGADLTRSVRIEMTPRADMLIDRK